MIFYEAPHRLKKSLEDLQQIFGDREISIGREVSKVHEEFFRGALSAILLELAERDVKGELTLVVHGATAEFEIAEDQLDTEIARLIAPAAGSKKFPSWLAGVTGWPNARSIAEYWKLKTRKLHATDGTSASP